MSPLTFERALSLLIPIVWRVTGPGFLPACATLLLVRCYQPR